MPPVTSTQSNDRTVDSVDHAQALDRGRLRRRQAKVTSIANLAARLITSVTTLATIPFVLGYLGVERFGLWMTISSFIALLGFADLGLGNGVLNLVSGAMGRDDRSLIRRIASNAWALLSAIGLLFLITALSFIYFDVFDWVAALGVKSQVAIAEIKPTLIVFVVCFSLSIATGVVQRVQMGMQLGLQSATTTGMAALAAAVFTILAIWSEAGLPWLLAGILGGPLIVSGVSIVYFYCIYRDLFPRWQDFNLATMQSIVGVGGLFFVLQVCGSLAYSTDNAVVARFVGAESVAGFAVATKLFNIVTMVTTVLVSPLWPAYAEAHSRGDHRWIHEALRRSIKQTALLSISGCSLILLLFNPICTLWLGHRLDVSIWLLGGIALWTLVAAMGMALAVFLNGVHLVRQQVACAIFCAVGSVTMKPFAVDHWGLNVLPWTMIAVYGATTIAPYCVIVPKLLKLYRQ